MTKNYINIISITKNTNMTNISIFILLLTFLVIPFRLSAYAMLDYFSNDGLIKIDLFGINIFTGKLKHKYIDDISSIVITSTMEEKILHLNNNKEDDKSISKLLTSNFIPSVDIVAIDNYITIGKSNDAFFTAMSMSFIKIILKSILSFLSNREKIDIQTHYKTHFNSDEIKFELYGIIDITFADIIYSVIKTFKRNIIKKGGKKVVNR